jgi:hypothetical protein
MAVRGVGLTKRYSTYLKFGNARENLMEKCVFLGVPKNQIFVGLRRFFLAVAIMGSITMIFFRFFLSRAGSLLTRALSLGTLRRAICTLGYFKRVYYRTGRARKTRKTLK